MSSSVEPEVFDEPQKYTKAKSPRARRRKRELMVGTFVNANAKLMGVAKPQPRKHLYVGRVSKTHDVESIETYCGDSKMGLLHIRKVSKEDAMWNSFHCFFDDSNSAVDNPNTWPTNVTIGRFRLNDEARQWLRTLPKPSRQPIATPLSRSPGDSQPSLDTLKRLRYSLFNARSVRKSAMEVHSSILASESQLSIITESWIQENDQFYILQCLPEFSHLSAPRPYSVSCGILKIYHIDIRTDVLGIVCNVHFEAVVCGVLLQGASLLFICC